MKKRFSEEQITCVICGEMAGRGGFEPPIGLHLY